MRVERHWQSCSPNRASHPNDRCLMSCCLLCHEIVSPSLRSNSQGKTVNRKMNEKIDNTKQPPRHELNLHSNRLIFKSHHFHSFYHNLIQFNEVTRDTDLSEAQHFPNAPELFSPEQYFFSNGYFPESFFFRYLFPEANFRNEIF